MVKNFCFIILLSGISLRAFSQGCSDAGFCSVGALKNSSLNEQPKHQLDLGFNFGYGVQQTLTYNPYVQYGVMLNNRFQIQGKLTATYATGFLGANANIGDLYGIATYTAKKSTVNDISLIGGIKIPLSTANDKGANGLALPLDYQSSLGTYDLIAGINYVLLKHFEADAGIQLPIIQENHNTFFPDDYNETRVKYFPPTNQLHRQPDVLFRLGYYINLPNSIILKPNLLAIYRIGLDSYKNRSGVSSVLSGTGGLTLNQGVNLTKQFKNHNQLEIIAAAPLVSKATDDGLIRELVLNIQYSFAVK
jgi:hypothetical protein